MSVTVQCLTDAKDIDVKDFMPYFDEDTHLSEQQQRQQLRAKLMGTVSRLKANSDKQGSPTI